MSKSETYELKRFIWLNVLGWADWTEENFPNRKGYQRGKETCLEIDMVDPLSAEGMVEVLKKCQQRGAVILRENDHGVSVMEDFNAKNSGNVFGCQTLELAVNLFAQKLFSK